MRVALALPYPVAAFAAATATGAAVGWWRRYWSLRTRVHQTLLALAGSGFVRQLAELGFLPW